MRVFLWKKSNFSVKGSQTMSIGYTNVFTSIGKFVKNVNYYGGTLNPAIATIKDEIGNVVSGNEEWDTLDGFDALHNNIQDAVTGWVTQYGQKVSKEFTNFSRVVQFLAISGSSSVSDTLVAIIRDMILNSQSVLKCTGTVGSVSADLSNVGTAVVMTGNVLDGVSSPDPNNSAPVSYNYLGILSQLMPTTEVVTLTAISDSGSGASEGAETFTIIGADRPRQPYDWKSEGSGIGPNIQVFNGFGILQNGEFETWTVTNTPDNWSYVTGVVTTNFAKDTSHVFRGLASFNIKGDGSTATLEAVQDMSARGLKANKSYFVGVWIQGQAGIAAGALTIQFTGTGYSAGTTEKITMNAAALAGATSYALHYFQVNMPTIVPSDFKLSIKITGTMTNAKNIYLDGMVLGECVWHGGVAYGIIAGATPIRKNDRYTLTNSNDNAGKFQTFMRRMFHVQLPSVSSSETITDTLAS